MFYLSEKKFKLAFVILSIGALTLLVAFFASTFFMLTLYTYESISKAFKDRILVENLDDNKTIETENFGRSPKLAVLGEALPEQETNPHGWPDKRYLVNAAIDHFLKRQNLESALYLKTLHPDYREPDQKSLKLAEKYFQNLISRVLLGGMKYQALSASKNLANQLDNLGIIDLAAMIHNIKIKIKEEGLPPEIGKIIINEFFRRSKNKNVKIMAPALSNISSGEVETRLEAEKLFETLFRSSKFEDNEIRKLSLSLDDPYYLRQIDLAYREELKKLARYDESFANLAPDALFERLPAHWSFLFVNNMRFVLKNAGIPEKLNFIIFNTFAKSLKSALLRRGARDLLVRSAPELRTDYVNTAEFISRQVWAEKTRLLITRALEAYLQKCITDQWEEWGKGEEKSRNWILNACRSSWQNKVMKPEQKRLSSKEFFQLRHFHRWALAKKIISIPPSNAYPRELFSSVAFWDDIIVSSVARGLVLRDLRSNPRWLKKLLENKYDEALQVMEKEYKFVTGTTLPGELRRKMSSMLDCEKKYWKEMISPVVWDVEYKNEYDKVTGNGRSFTLANYMAALDRSFPDYKRLPKKRLLQALCLLNRGRAVSKVCADLKINIKYLKKYLPKKEFSK